MARPDSVSLQPARPSRRFVRRVDRRHPFGEGRSPQGLVRRERIQRRGLAAADATAALIAFTSVTLAATGEASWAVLPIALLIVIIHKLAGLYDRDELLLNKTTLDEVPQLVQLSAVVCLSSWLLFPPLAGIELEPSQVLGLWGGSVVVLVAGRGIARRLLRVVTSAQRCLAVGDDPAVRTIAEKLGSPAVDAALAGTMVVDGTESSEVLTDELRRLLDELGIERVVVAPQSMGAGDVLELVRVAKLRGVRVTVLPRLFEVVGSTVVPDQVDGTTMLGVRRFGLTRSSRLVKRCFDLAGAGVLLLFALPLMTVIAFAICLESRGGILFRQTRVGRDGERFQMLKFRSMCVDAENQKEGLRERNEVIGLFKLADDPRVTRVGRWLRRTSLDELPQLWNVVRGEMSLVGPRPLIIEEDALVLGLDRARLHLTPGMTGPWQVLGAARVPMQEMVTIDFLYVASWSLWTDVKILLRTVAHVLRKRGL